MTELCGAGWLVDGQRKWNYQHQADWLAPSVRSIVEAWQRAWRDGDKLGGRAREFALGYDVRKILAEHWVPVLDKLARERAGFEPAPGQGPSRRTAQTLSRTC